MHAFGLEETNFYREAEKQARKVGTVCIAKFVSKVANKFSPTVKPHHPADLFRFKV